MVQVTLTHAIAVAALLATTCKTEPLATLGGRAIRDSDFQQYAQANYDPDRVADMNRNRASRDLAWQAYLDSLALAARARQLGVDKDEHFQKAVELMEDKTLAQMVLGPYRDRVVNAAHVSMDEARRSYEDHKADFLIQPHFTFRQVLVYTKGNPAFPDRGRDDAAARARAQQALRALHAGMGWDALASTYSDDTATANRGGLIRDAHFGPFAPEIEAAVRTQRLGSASVVRSAFGYHVVQAEDRLLDPAPEPFERVQAVVIERLSRTRADEARKAVVASIAKEVELDLREGHADVSLSDEQAIAADTVLARVAGRPVHESDFRWFVKDAVIAPQRQLLFSRPAARQDMLRSFVDLCVLAAHARRHGMHKSADFQQARAARIEQLLGEFVQQRDGVGPFCTAPSQAECQRTEQEYLRRIRGEVGLKVTARP